MKKVTDEEIERALLCADEGAKVRALELLTGVLPSIETEPETGLPVFRDIDLPNMATHCPQTRCGFSLYKGVLVQWDEDRDTRVLIFIDSLPEEVRNKLLVVQEHKAMLGLLWKWRVPSRAYTRTL